MSASGRPSCASEAVPVNDAGGRPDIEADAASEAFLGSSGMDRREFLLKAGAGTGVLLGGACAGQSRSGSASPRAPSVRLGQIPDVAVVGAGNFGNWTVLHLQRLGARVTLIDQYGPGNSRSASGGETRGVRTSYGDRLHGIEWSRWAARAIERWKEWDERYFRDGPLPRLFYTTGDVIMRDEVTPFLEVCMENWDEMDWPYELLTPEEIRYRWPVMETPDTEVGLYEPRAGVVRARRAMESVAQVFQAEGGDLRIGRARIGAVEGREVVDLMLAEEGGERISAGLFVFALGPWFPKFFPGLMTNRLRISTLGHTYYFSTPPGSEAYRFPNLPSYNVPGVTGWPALPSDSRGFRIRTGGHSSDDPDESRRWIPEENHQRPRDVLARYFPELAQRAINETRACHYCGTVSRNFIIDRHPQFDNGWLAGGGSAESFKQGPVLGEYIARRVLNIRGDDDPDRALDEGFRLLEEEFEVERGFSEAEGEASL